MSILDDPNDPDYDPGGVWLNPNDLSQSGDKYAGGVAATYVGGGSSGGRPWYEDVLDGAKTAAAYLLKGEVAKIANKQKLPNSPAVIQSSVKSWIIWAGVVVAVGAIVVIAIKKA